MRSTADPTPGAAEQHQHEADHQRDESEGPQDRYPEQQTEEEKDDAHCDHGAVLPLPRDASNGQVSVAAPGLDREAEGMTSPRVSEVLTIVTDERARTVRQVASLESVVAAIVEGSELVSTDDEHDPEGATIAYERAQAIALLRQARADLEALDETRRQLESDGRVVCSVCGRDIGLERIAALPMASRCVRCAA